MENRCIECGRLLKYKDTKLCRQCYLKKSKPKRNCIYCGIELKDKISKLCRKCYLKNVLINKHQHPRWKGGKPKCVACGIETKDYDSVLCRKCYLKNKKHKVVRKNNRCIDCGIAILKASKRCKSCAKKGKNSPTWKGGRTIVKKRNGSYAMLKIPSHPNAHKSGYVFEHTFIMSNVIGRPLKEDELVHHIDGNGLNNDPSNLKLETQKTHISNNHLGSRVLSKCQVEEIARLYFEEYKSGTDLAKIYNVTPQTIYYWLKKYGKRKSNELSKL